jgi:ADP-ribosylation factor related protein 1
VLLPLLLFFLGGAHMFTLSSGIWRYLMRKDEFRVLVLGLDKSGKTTFLESIKHDYLQLLPLSPDKIMPTVGLNIAQIDIGKIKIIIWDLGGLPDLQPIWEKYYADCHAIIYVIDSSDSERLLEAIQVFSKSNLCIYGACAI